MKIQAILVASVSLALWGCGSESGGDGDPQSELADLLVDEESTITEDAVSNGTDATETTISDDGIEAPTETGPVAETTAAPAGASSVEVIESTKSLPISVDVGGASANPAAAPKLATASKIRSSPARHILMSRAAHTRTRCPSARSARHGPPNPR